MSEERGRWIGDFWDPDTIATREQPMTWKPTEEMRQVYDDAADPLGFGDNDILAGLIAVQPLIAAEERERLTKMFARKPGGLWASQIIRALIPKPPDTE